MRRASPALTLLVLAGTAAAQGPTPTLTTFNGWYVYQGDHHLKGRWELHLEDQMRLRDTVREWRQNLFRTGLNFLVNERLTLSGGYAQLTTFAGNDSPGLPTIPEHRIWQMATLSQRLPRVRLQHRVRTEQRWIRSINGGGNPSDYRYFNRLRFSERAITPLHGQWFATSGAEIFVEPGAGGGRRALNQYRLGAGIGKRITRNNSVEFGYLYRRYITREGLPSLRDHVLQITFNSRTPFGKR